MISNRLHARRSVHPDFDVVVVGASSAGAATAMLLARAGARVALVDRASTGVDIASPRILMRAGVIQLHRWGLLDRVIAAGTPAVRQTIFRYGRDTTTVTLKRVGGVDALYAPRRSVLNPILVQAAREAGTDVQFGISVADVDRAANGRVIGVVGHDEHHDPVRLGAAITVGADGVHSTIARAVGATIQQKASNASSFIFGQISGLDTVGYEWLYAPGVTAAVIPTNHGQSCVSVGAPEARFRSELSGNLPGSFRQLLADASPELAANVARAGTPGHLHSFDGIAGFVRRPWGPGWALVGDAGYFKDPITAHGPSDGLRDAELVAEAAAAILGGSVGEEGAMRKYHETRDRLSLQLFSVTDTIASYQWDTRSVEVHLRALSAAMVDEVDYLLASAVADPGGGLGHHKSQPSGPLAVASRGQVRSGGQQ